MSKAKPSLSLMEIESYALPSSSFVKNDSHTFVVNLERNICWMNHGGGWSDTRTKTKVAFTSAYKEWLLEFAPTSNVDKCGINFGYNGVCHTYANRELLVSNKNACVKNADKDYVCVFFFGKYGLGLDELKNLLTSSYYNVMNTYSDPYNALSNVLAKVDDYLDDELAAWKQTAIDYGKIDVDAILNKNRSGGISEAKRRLTKYIAERESIYKQYKDNRGMLRNMIKQAIISHSTNYLNFLVSINYITASQKNSYISNISSFLGIFSNSLEAQTAHFESTGMISMEGLI